MKTIIYALALGCVVSFWSGFASAESFTVQGRVTGVETIYKTRTTTKPVQQCWLEEVPVYGHSGNNDTTGDMLKGAIIGGIIGNNLKGEDGGGAAGAVLGGILGHQNSKNKNGQVITGYRQVEQCTTQYNTHTEEYLAGYKITYSALGLSGVVSRTNKMHIGDSINVNVQISAY